MIVMLHFFGYGYINNLTNGERGVVAGHDDGSQPGVVEGNGRCWRAVQEVQRHAVAPDGSAAFDNYERAAWDFWQRRERLGRGDRRGDCDGVDDVIQQFNSSSFLGNMTSEISCKMLGS